MFFMSNFSENVSIKQNDCGNRFPFIHLYFETIYVLIYTNPIETRVVK